MGVAWAASYRECLSAGARAALMRGVAGQREQDMTLRRLLFTVALLAGAQAQASERALEAPIVAHGEPAAQLQKQLDARPVFVAQYQAKAVEGAGKLSGVVSFSGAA